MIGIQIVWHNINWSDQKEDILFLIVRVIKIINKFPSFFLMGICHLGLISSKTMQIQS